MQFDRMRLATSVVNRILNTADQIRARKTSQLPRSTPGPVPQDPPNLADPLIEGAELDLAFQEPTPSVAAPDALAEGAIAKGLNLPA